MKQIEQTLPQRHGGNGQPKIDGTYFTRASVLAKTLDSTEGLMQWKAKMAAKGIASSDELRSLAAVTDISDYRWREIVNRACDLAGGSHAADLGTSIHAVTEHWDVHGAPPKSAPDSLIADAAAYQGMMDQFGLEPIAAEMFVANASLQAAGSFDRLVTGPDGRMRILDIKTVRGDKDAEAAARSTGVAWSIQIATYANSKPYDGKNGWMEWADFGLDAPLSTGVNAYVAVIPRGSGTCFLVDINLDEGLRLAELAVAVRRARKTQPALPRTS